MQKYEKELRQIAAAHDGILYPKDVVDAAKNPQSPLHEAFEWDDGAAAEKYRLWQARKLISVIVTVINKAPAPVRAFVSLTPNRIDDGGYIAMEKVLSQEKLRTQMLRDATNELRIFTAKFNSLKELAVVNAAANEFIAGQEAQ